MKVTKEGHGLTVTDTLLVIFVYLKLDGVIGWPWWLVLMPVWIMAACGLILGIHAAGKESKP